MNPSPTDRTPFAGEPWADAYRYGMNLAVLYASKRGGANHPVAPYLHAQDAWEGVQSCACEQCRADLAREGS